MLKFRGSQRVGHDCYLNNNNNDSDECKIQSSSEFDFLWTCGYAGQISWPGKPCDGQQPGFSSPQFPHSSQPHPPAPLGLPVHFPAPVAY